MSHVWGQVPYECLEFNVELLLVVLVSWLLKMTS